MADLHDDTDDSTATSTDDSEILAQSVYDPTEWHDLTSAIVYTLADAKGISPEELKTCILHEAVNVEAIEAVFFDPERSPEPAGVSNRIVFEYETYRVEIWDDGRIRVRGHDQTID